MGTLIIDIPFLSVCWQALTTHVMHVYEGGGWQLATRYEGVGWQLATRYEGEGDSQATIGRNMGDNLIVK